MKDSLEREFKRKITIEPSIALQERIKGASEEEIVNTGLEYSMQKSGNFHFFKFYMNFIRLNILQN